MSVRKKYKQNRRMRKLRKPTVLFPLIAFALLCLWGVSCAMRDRGQKMLPRETLTIINAKGARCVFTVELAVTPEEQEEGLMYRRSLAANAGIVRFSKAAGRRFLDEEHDTAAGYDLHSQDWRRGFHRRKCRAV